MERCIILINDFITNKRFFLINGIRKLPRILVPACTLNVKKWLPSPRPIIWHATPYMSRVIFIYFRQLSFMFSYSNGTRPEIPVSSFWPLHICDSLLHITFFQSSIHCDWSLVFLCLGVGAGFYWAFVYVIQLSACGSATHIDSSFHPFVNCSLNSTHYWLQINLHF